MLSSSHQSELLRTEKPGKYWVQLASQTPSRWHPRGSREWWGSPHTDSTFQAHLQVESGNSVAKGPSVMFSLCIEHYLIHLLDLRSFYFLHQPEMEIFLFHILHFSATGYFKWTMNKTDEYYRANSSKQNVGKDKGAKCCHCTFVEVRRV